MKKHKILCAFGTRPEVIKMAPIVTMLKVHPSFDLTVVATAQHREMLDQMLDIFQIVPDIDMNIMQKGQSLSQLTANLPVPLEEILKQTAPDLVLAQGDTTTAFMVSLACFYQKIPFGHVEAGLRTGTIYDPFPEEMNRLLISRLSTLNFAPTEQSKLNLLHEGFPAEQIFVTGNTVIDSLHHILKQEIPLDPRIDSAKRLLLVTAHRRENHGAKLEEICRALKFLAEKNSDIQILYPVHPNPRVFETVQKKLAGHPRILLSEPLPYHQFVKTMQQAHLILSDSGGVQEEAPALGTPVLVIRDTTERGEAEKMGAAKLIGTQYDSIVEQTQLLLDDQEKHRKMRFFQSPFGDGKAAGRIIEIVKGFLEKI